MLYPEDVRHMVALYDGEILNADRQVKVLLGEIESLGLEKKTLVVIFSEHGDMMGKHGRFMRGGPLRGTLYDDVLRVPLILRHPSLPPARIAGLVQLIDLAPTLLDIVGLPSPDSFSGKSLRPLIMEGKGVNDCIFAGSAYTPRKTSLYFRDASITLAIRGDEWKLIHERVFSGSGPVDQYELYRLKRDPDELENLAEREPAVLARLKKDLDEWLKSIGAQEVQYELLR
jgi:arylsulfatase A-like enzyme